MSTYTVIIGEGTQQFTFSSTLTQFVPRISNQFNQIGTLDNSTEIYQLTGRLVGSGGDPAASTIALWKELRAVAQRGQAQRFRILRDTTPEIDLKPAEMVDGPYILDFTVLPTGGSFANHVAYTMLVSITPQGNTQFAPQPQVQGLQRIVEEEAIDNDVVRKEWRAVASGNDAESLVNSFRPSNVDPLRSIITRELDANRVQARYIWQPSEDDVVWSETVVVTPGGRPKMPVLTQPEEGGDADTAFPTIFKGRVRPTTVVIDVKVTGQRDQLPVFPITFHLDEDAFDEPRSPYDMEPQLVDKRRNVYQIRSRETYVFADPLDVGSLSHGDHEALVNPEAANAPGDGAIAG